jgi:leucyl-tRNA synthetase
MIIKNGAKMSKSLGNVVSPDDMVARYGADSTRLYTLFATSPDRELDWQDEGVEGVLRFLSRVYRFVTRNAANPNRSDGTSESATPESRKIQRKLHQTIKRVSEDFQGRWHFNTSIAAIMTLVNELVAAESAMDAGEVSPEAVAEVFRNLVLMLAPFAPFFAAEMWEQIGGEGVVFRTAWPVADEELARENEMEIPVQANGKLVTVVKVPAGSDEATVKSAVLGDEKVKARIEGRTVVKTIVVPGKLINLVVK